MPGMTERFELFVNKKEVRSVGSHAASAAMEHVLLALKAFTCRRVHSSVIPGSTP